MMGYLILNVQNYFPALCHKLKFSNQNPQKFLHSWIQPVEALTALFFLPLYSQYVEKQFDVLLLPQGELKAYILLPMRVAVWRHCQTLGMKNLLQSFFGTNLRIILGRLVGCVFCFGSFCIVKFSLYACCNFCDYFCVAEICYWQT